MPKIAVVIPTYKRIKKLERCLQSIESQTHKDLWVNVYCDNGDSETFNYVGKRESKVPTIATENAFQEFVIGSWNDFFTSSIMIPGVKHFWSWDAVAWIVDDVELYPDCLEKSIEAMQANFPDFDGVVGIKQECPDNPRYTYKSYGQVIIGRKFVERYKEVNYKVCCPDYKHFWQDCEMFLHATSLNKFILGDGKLKHYHPGFINKEIDETHHIVRGEIKRQDDRIFQERQSKGLVWGKSFELINVK